MEEKNLNIYEINEFNKKIKELKKLEGVDNTKRQQELNEELKNLKMIEIKMDGKLTAQDWLKKAYLEQEIERYSSVDKQKQENQEKLQAMMEEKAQILRELDLKEAELQIKIANLQKEWDKATKSLNEIMTQMRSVDKESEEYNKLQQESEKYRTTMVENSIISEKGTKLQKELEDIRGMKNLLKSGEVLEGLTKPEGPGKGTTGSGKGTTGSGKGTTGSEKGTTGSEKGRTGLEKQKNNYSELTDEELIARKEELEKELEAVIRELDRRKLKEPGKEPEQEKNKKPSIFSRIKGFFKNIFNSKKQQALPPAEDSKKTGQKGNTGFVTKVPGREEDWERALSGEEKPINLDIKVKTEVEKEPLDK